MADNTFFAQLQDFKLAGSGIGLTDASITMQSLLQIDGTPVVMTNFGDIGYGTLEPGTSREEQITWAGITQNANGTATLTGVIRGVEFVSPYSQDLNLRKAHAGSSTFRVSNTAAFYSQFPALDNDETITGIWTFTNPDYPQMDTATPAPTLDGQLVPKKYVDDTAIAGAPDAGLTTKGIVEIATTAETQAGTDVGSTGAFLTAVPSDISGNIQDSKFTYSSIVTDDFANAFLTGGTAAQSVAATWAAVTDGSFRITIDGTAYNVDAIDFSGNATMAAVATTIESAVQTATGSTETVVWSTDKFIITTVGIDASSSSITVTSTSTGVVGTDISGAGASDWMDCDTGNGVVTQAVMSEFTVTLTPAITSYSEGQEVSFKASNSVIGPVNVDVNGLGTKAIKKNHDKDTELDDIEAGSIVVIIYDGTNFQLQTPQATMPSTSILSEMDSFFSSTDMSGAQATTLTAGPASDASSLHTHTTDSIMKNFITIEMGSDQSTGAGSVVENGYSVTCSGILNPSGNAGVSTIPFFLSGSEITMVFKINAFTASGNGNAIYGLNNGGAAAVNPFVGVYFDGPTGNILARCVNGGGTTDVIVASPPERIVYVPNVSATYFNSAGALIATINTNVPSIPPYIQFVGSGSSGSSGTVGYYKHYSYISVK